MTDTDLPRRAQEAYPRFFLQSQASMTSPARHFLYGKANAAVHEWLLDVGCGYGDAILEYTEIFGGLAIGLDLDPGILKTARQKLSKRTAGLILADAHHPPIRDQACPLISSHFVLMWTHTPSHVIQSIHRILKPGGLLLGMESDYTGRIENIPGAPLDSPPQLSRLVEVLLRMGAHPFLGHHLFGLLETRGFKLLYYGILAWEYHVAQAEFELEEERRILAFLGACNNHPDRFAYTPVVQYLAQRVPP